MSVQLRAVLFHDVADSPSTFTSGLAVTMAVDRFRARIEFLARRYRPVSLDEVRASLHGTPLPRRAVLVTIDDAYASVHEEIAPVLEQFDIPAVFFVNSGFLDHRELSIDNLVAHAFNTVGGSALSTAVAQIGMSDRPTSIAEALQRVVPSMTIGERGCFGRALSDLCAVDPLSVAREEGLYLSSAAVVDLPASMEIASHTTSHARCRTITTQEDFDAEIAENRSALMALTGSSVRAFSVPYGSQADRPDRVVEAVRASGHDLIFLVEGLLNHGTPDSDGMFRVSLKRPSNLGMLLELEIEPRLRRIRNQIRQRASGYGLT